MRIMVAELNFPWVQIRGCRKIDEPGLAISQATFFLL